MAAPQDKLVEKLAQCYVQKGFVSLETLVSFEESDQILQEIATTAER